MNPPLPLEQTDNELALNIQKIIEGKSLIKGFYASVHGLILSFHNGQIKKYRRERNSLCLCGSGKKYKKCHENKYENL